MATRVIMNNDEAVRKWDFGLLLAYVYSLALIANKRVHKPKTIFVNQEPLSTGLYSLF